MREDDPDAPPSEEEKRAAAALRKSLEPGPPGSPPSLEAKWLSAHLRLPTAEDGLGDVRGWRLARAAREGAQTRKRLAEQRSDAWTRFTHVLTSSGGLLAAAGLLLFLSWIIVGQGRSPRLESAELAPSIGDGQHPRFKLSPHGSAVAQRASQMLLFRESFKRHESPAQRIDLMIATRLAERRTPRSSEPTHLQNMTAAAFSLASALK